MGEKRIRKESFPNEVPITPPWGDPISPTWIYTIPGLTLVTLMNTFFLIHKSHVYLTTCGDPCPLKVYNLK
jgi:hypothetical protein